MSFKFAVHLNSHKSLNDKDFWSSVWEELRKLSTYPTYPSNMDPLNVVRHADTIMRDRGIHMREHEVVLVVTGENTMPEHPLVGVNVIPASRPGWFLRVADLGVNPDQLWSDFGQWLVTINHSAVEDLSLVPESDFGHLNNQQLSELLGCYRMLNFQSYPVWTKGQEVPHGVQLPLPRGFET